MAIVWADGCDYLATVAELSNTSTGGYTINQANDASHYAMLPTGGKYGGGAYQMIGSTTDDTRITRSHASATASGRSAWWQKMDKVGTGVTAAAFARITSGGTNQLELGFTSSTNALGIYRAGTLLGSTGTSDIDDGNWHFIEWNWSIADSGGTSQVLVDGVSIVNITSDDTKNGTNTTASRILWAARRTDASNYWNLTIDDVLSDDSSTLVGTHRILPLVPISDTATIQMTPDSGSNHFSRMSDLPYLSTTYNKYTASDKTDLYNMTALRALPGGSTILALQMVALFSRVSTAQTAHLKNRIISNGNTSDGVDTSCNSASAFTAKTFYTTDPNTSAAWTQSGINACTMGANGVSISGGDARYYSCVAEVIVTPAFTGVDYPAAVDVGAFTLTGIAVTLTYVAHSVAYTLAVAVGAFTLTGINAILSFGHIGAGFLTGAFTFTGNSVGVAAAKSIAIGTGSFILTGINAAITGTRTMAVAVASFTLTGISITLRRTSSVGIGVGSFVLSGIDAILRHGQSIHPGAGSFLFTGIATLLRKVLQHPRRTNLKTVLPGAQPFLARVRGAAARLVK
jgi:hypothetical protein